MSASKRFMLFVIFVGSFFAFFAARMWYGYEIVPDGPRIISSRTRVPKIAPHEITSRRNFARDGESRYELVAEISISSRSFDKDARALRGVLAGAGGTTQFERSIGRSDAVTRAVVIAYAVSPDLFAKTCEQVRDIGRLEISNVTRDDRTAQYVRLSSELEALESSDRALLELRRGKGSIEEMAELQRRILDVERQMQDARARIAPFEREDLCTLRVTLYEDAEVTVPPPSLRHRSMVAFKWAVKYWLAFLLSIALFSIAAFFILATLARITDIFAPRGRHVRVYDQIVSEPPAAILPEVAAEAPRADDDTPEDTEKKEDGDA